MEARLAGLDTLTMSSRSLADDYFIPAMRARAQAKKDVAQSGGTAQADSAKKERTPEQMEAQRKQREVVDELSEQKILRAAFSDRQLEEVMTDFWFNHFNVFAGKGADARVPDRVRARRHSAARARQVSRSARRHREQPGDAVLSRQLAERRPERATSAQTDASVRPYDADRRRRSPLPPSPRAAAAAQPEHAAARPQRELRPRADGAAHARRRRRLHAGRRASRWRALSPAGRSQDPRQGGGFRFEPRMHDAGEKIVLGHTIKAGGGRTTASRCSTSWRSIRRRRASSRPSSRDASSRDKPPPALVDRAAARFQATDGDIREVLRTILTSPEFFAPEAYRAKVKTPFEFVVSAVRATGTDVPDALPLVQPCGELGMPLYLCQPPTGYADRADAWVNTGALLEPMNFAVDARERPACAASMRPRATSAIVARRDDRSWRQRSPATLAATACDAGEGQRARAGDRAARSARRNSRRR